MKLNVLLNYGVTSKLYLKRLYFDFHYYVVMFFCVIDLEFHKGKDFRVQVYAEFQSNAAMWLNSVPNMHILLMLGRS